ncbi:MAG: DUF3108 domain-containing protein [Gammaproteobacteria bacterium]|nr:DUF3108 domain-containing protein [Gammaproteobacteria bacterium]
MKKLIPIGAGVLALVMGPVWVAQAAELRPLEAHYELTHSGITMATNTVTLSGSDQSVWLYRSVTEAAGLLSLVRSEMRIETSRMKRQGDRLVPLEYHYERLGGKNDRNVVISFDWPNQRALNTVEGQTWELPVPIGTQDKFGMQLSLMLDSQRGIQPLSYPIADGGTLKEYRFEFVETAKVDTGIGELEAHHLRRQRDNDERVTDVWLAPELGYFPVRIDQTKKGEGSATMRLERFAYTD